MNYNDTTNDAKKAIEAIKSYCKARKIEDCEAQNCGIDEWCTRILSRPTVPEEWEVDE